MPSIFDFKRILQKFTLFACNTVICIVNAKIRAKHLVNGFLLRNRRLGANKNLHDLMIAYLYTHFDPAVWRENTDHCAMRYMMHAITREGI